MTTFPQELYTAIVREVEHPRDLAQLCCVGPTQWDARILLYSNIRIVEHGRRFRRWCHTVSTKPHLAALVRSLHVSLHPTTAVEHGSPRVKLLASCFAACRNITHLEVHPMLNQAPMRSSGDIISSQSTFKLRTFVNYYFATDVLARILASQPHILRLDMGPLDRHLSLACLPALKLLDSDGWSFFCTATDALFSVEHLRLLFRPSSWSGRVSEQHAIHILIRMLTSADVRLRSLSIRLEPSYSPGQALHILNMIANTFPRLENFSFCQHLPQNAIPQQEPALDQILPAICRFTKLKSLVLTMPEAATKVQAMEFANELVRAIPFIQKIRLLQAEPANSTPGRDSRILFTRGCWVSPRWMGLSWGNSEDKDAFWTHLT